MGALIKSYEYFHIFFIPIFRWNEKYYVMCKRCNSIYEISKEKGKAIENGEINEVNLEDMTLIQEGQVYGKRAVKKFVLTVEKLQREIIIIALIVEVKFKCISI